MYPLCYMELMKSPISVFCKPLCILATTEARGMAVLKFLQETWIKICLTRFYVLVISQLQIYNRDKLIT